MDVANYGMQAALGLAHAHEQGVVHRDVKPSNLLLSDTKQVKVLDLGLGVLMEADEESNFATADGIAVGTIDYMSPEQACGKEVDGRSDVFSLGCTMYHLIAGKLPYPGESPIDRLGRRLGGDRGADHGGEAGRAGRAGEGAREDDGVEAIGPVSEGGGGSAGASGVAEAAFGGTEGCAKAGECGEGGIGG